MDKYAPTGSRIDCLLDLGRAMERIFEVRLRPLGCSPTQLRIMEAAGAATSDAENTPTALALGVLQQPHSISEMLTRLQDTGFIKRQADEQDGRVVHVSLTAKGDLLLHQAGEVRRRLEAQVREIQRTYFFDDWAEQILALDEWQKVRKRG